MKDLFVFSVWLKWEFLKNMEVQGSRHGGAGRITPKPNNNGRVPTTTKHKQLLFLCS